MNLSFSNEVKTALLNNKAIVALESTIIAHGLPYPDNLLTALKAEEIIRANMATPATIAIINGEIKVGLSKDDLNYIAQNKDKFIKTSRRDLPYIVMKKLNAATTVSATMYIASLAQIKIFTTGGIGGVHLGAEESFDISTDLFELSQTNVCVISAGAKSILDISKTMEYLETIAVPVISYKSDYFAGFYTSKTPNLANFRLDSSKQIADFLKTKWRLGLNGGVIVSNPIKPNEEIPSEIINKAVNEAINEAKINNIKAKELTPFLLEKITNITEGKSLKANISLFLSNCELAANIAVDYKKSL